MCHAVSKYMAARRSGVIINIGSISGEEGGADSVDYSMCKSGIMYGLTKSLVLYGAVMASGYAAFPWDRY
jgi:NAD(P)-dependent dehydrogenase (short-subunit alcohol dehydrogenase family)